MRSHAVSTAMVCGTVVLTAAILSHAGPLDPPAGAIAPTYKTLTEVEPRTAINPANTPGDAGSVYRITAPGSYYLTGNLVGVSGKAGIDIATVDAHIDLNGFEVVGVAGSLSGIRVTGTGGDGCSVSHGTVRSWGAMGVDLITGGAHGSKIEDVQAIGNGSTGLRVGSNGLFIGCTSENNGLSGFEFSANGVAENCVARSNGGKGFDTGTGCIYRGCIARSNSGTGIEVGEGGSAEQCTAIANSGDGFLLFNGAVVRGCGAYQNSVSGFSATARNSVIHCTAASNVAHGILAGSDCLIVGNSASLNGASPNAGIAAGGSDNRIEGNNVSDNGIGISVLSAGNIVLRNTASGNSSNYNLVAGNVCLVVSATTSGAFTGSSGGVSPGSTDPSANFSY